MCCVGASSWNQFNPHELLGSFLLSFFLSFFLSGNDVHNKSDEISFLWATRFLSLRAMRFLSFSSSFFFSFFLFFGNDTHDKSDGISVFKSDEISLFKSHEISVIERDEMSAPCRGGWLYLSFHSNNWLKVNAFERFTTGKCIQMQLLQVHTLVDDSTYFCIRMIYYRQVHLNSWLKINAFERVTTGECIRMHLLQVHPYEWFTTGKCIRIIYWR